MSPHGDREDDRLLTVFSSSFVCYAVFDFDSARIWLDAMSSVRSGSSSSSSPASFSNSPRTSIALPSLPSQTQIPWLDRLLLQPQLFSQLSSASSHSSMPQANLSSASSITSSGGESSLFISSATSTTASAGGLAPGSSFALDGTVLLPHRVC